ncbi:MAG: hypothetical protein Q8M88_08585 [Phenylobacterium sp.]|uniref:hypothetical protein n=1 Tax=Phenylobacterium sp. TaxID=1871053 RepID=UPI0027332BBA|nr:hypothetical protein [Phenylobacterium sp.]MDP3174474.1 hypothetical protein [Phenylobacterium sp.]
MRALLMAAPFVVWFIWRDVAIRTGRPMGATPWTWLVAIGAILVGLSLMATALAPHAGKNDVYVPAEATASGQVTPGHFEKTRPQR